MENESKTIKKLRGALIVAKNYWDHYRKLLADATVYNDSIQKTIWEAIDAIKAGRYDDALAELRECDIVRRPVKEKVMKYKCIGRSTLVAAYEEPETKNLYIVPFIEGIRQIEEWQFEDNKSATDMLGLLLSDDGTSALTGNGFEIVDPGYDSNFTLGYDLDYSECKDDNDDMVKYGRLWEFAESYIWDPIEHMLSDGYLMLRYYWDEEWSVAEDDDVNDSKECSKAALNENDRMV